MVLCKARRRGNADTPLLRRNNLEHQQKQEVVDYMVARYGNFILYDPPLMASTLILWLGPLLVIVIGAATVVVRSRRAPAATKRMNNALSEEERRRLAELLKEEEKQ